MNKRKLEDRGSDYLGSKDYIYLGSNPNGSFSYYYLTATNCIEAFKGSISRGNHMSYQNAPEFFNTTKPIDSAIEFLPKPFGYGK